MENKMKITKLETLTYELHKYLLNNNIIGKENAITYSQLANDLGLMETMKLDSAKRLLRKSRQEHNSKRSDFMKHILICNNGIYLPKTMESREETQREIKKSVYYLRQKAIALWKEADNIEKQSGLEGQQRLKLSKYMQEEMEISAKELNDNE